MAAKLALRKATLLADTSSWTYLLSFETFFLLFLLAGIYKADPRFSWVPVDLTLLFFVLSFLAGTWILIQRRFHIHYHGLNVALAGVAFIVWIVITLLWTPSSEYAVQKTLYIAILNLWSLIGAALIIAPEQHRVHRFMMVFVFFAIWLAIEAVSQYVQGRTSWFVTVLGSNYLALGRVLSVAILIILGVQLSENRWWIKAFYLLLALLFFFVLLIAGGRGPFAATLGGLGVLLVGGCRFSKRKLIIRQYWGALLVALSLLGILMYLVASQGQLPTTIKRFLVLVYEPGGGISLTERLEWYLETPRLWGESPLVGHGIGSWPILIGLGDQRGYPHNIIAEVIVELGLVGLILFLALVVIALCVLGDWRGDPKRLVLMMVFTSTFLVAQVSGDIPDHRLMFAVLGLMALKHNASKG